MNVTDPNALLTVKDVCKLLRCCDKVVYNLVKDKKLAAIRLSPDSTWKFTREDVAAFVDRRRAEELQRPGRPSTGIKILTPKYPVIIEERNVQDPA